MCEDWLELGERAFAVIRLVFCFLDLGESWLSRRGSFLLFRQEFCIFSERFGFLKHICSIAIFELAREG